MVQGYKFNIFYPDLIDKVKAPTYKIVREHGRKRGESFAPAGEEDTCLIRFIAGPPYEDIAFRIVDKEWDYSAKRDRGFKSSFDKVCYSIIRDIRAVSRVNREPYLVRPIADIDTGNSLTSFPVQKDLLQEVAETCALYIRLLAAHSGPTWGRNNCVLGRLTHDL